MQTFTGATPMLRRFHFVFVTSNCCEVLSPEILEHLKAAFAGILLKHHSCLVKFEGMEDCIRLSVLIPQDLDIALPALARVLKVIASRRIRKSFAALEPTSAVWQRVSFFAKDGNDAREAIHDLLESRRRDRTKRCFSADRADTFCRHTATGVDNRARLKANPKGLSTGR
jgi:REP element-mobilizing transposase RayT